MATYRVGSDLRTIYRDESPIGIMDTIEDAAMTIEAMNVAERMRQRAALIWSTQKPPPCHREGMHNCAATGRWQSHDSSDPS